MADQHKLHSCTWKQNTSNLEIVDQSWLNTVALIKVMTRLCNCSDLQCSQAHCLLYDTLLMWTTVESTPVLTQMRDIWEKQKGEREWTRPKNLICIFVCEREKEWIKEQRILREREREKPIGNSCRRLPDHCLMFLLCKLLTPQQRNGSKLSSNSLS